MNGADPVLPGLARSLRALGDGLVATLHDRVALLALELEEEKFRLIQLQLWICGAMFAGAMALAFVSLTLVYLFWDSARIAVLAGLAAAYILLLAGALFGLRRLLARTPRAFRATLAELREDRKCLRGEP